MQPLAAWSHGWLVQPGGLTADSRTRRSALRVLQLCCGNHLVRGWNEFRAVCPADRNHPGLCPTGPGW
jgi:hypothetical protein